MVWNPPKANARSALSGLSDPTVIATGTEIVAVIAVVVAGTGTEDREMGSRETGSKGQPRPGLRPDPPRLLQTVSQPK